AEEEPRSAGAGAREERPGARPSRQPAYGAQRITDRLQQGSAGRQRGRIRGGRYPGRVACRGAVGRRWADAQQGSDRRRGIRLAPRDRCRGLPRRARRAVSARARDCRRARPQADRGAARVRLAVARRMACRERSVRPGCRRQGDAGGVGRGETDAPVDGAGRGRRPAGRITAMAGRAGASSAKIRPPFAVHSLPAVISGALMQQRQLRLGDILDDYCPRERRVTNHAIVAMIGEDVKQTRCTTCDADHEYKHAKVPRQRRKTETPAALYAQVVQNAPKRVSHEGAPTNGSGHANQADTAPETDTTQEIADMETTIVDATIVEIVEEDAP